MRSLFSSRSPQSASAVEPVPTVFPKIEGADIAALFAGNRVAGDMYDSIRVSPERILFGLLDVAGRRESNRSVLTTAQEVFRNVGAELFSGSDINEANAMTELNHRINRAIIDSCHGVRSCPAFIACYHEQFGTLCYTNAGHTPGLIRDHAGTTQLGSTGLPLGLFSHATADAPTVGLDKGAALLLVSRGVVECTGKGSEEFGLERVQRVLESIQLTSAHALCASVLKGVGEFTAGPLCDDRTALALLRNT